MDGLRPLRLSLRAVCLYEQITARSFSTLDLSDGADVEALSYALWYYATDEAQTLDRWRVALEAPSLATHLARELERVLSLLEQLSIQRASASSEGEGDAQPAHMTPIITRLAYSLGAEFVLDRMELWELPHYLESEEQRRRQELEEQRLFTWLSMLPHLSKDSARSAEELLPFPWEAERKEAEQQLDLDVLGELALRGAAREEE